MDGSQLGHICRGGGRGAETHLGITVVLIGNCCLCLHSHLKQGTLRSESSSPQKVSGCPGTKSPSAIQIANPHDAHEVAGCYPAFLASTPSASLCHSLICGVLDCVDRFHFCGESLPNWWRWMQIDVDMGCSMCTCHHLLFRGGVCVCHRQMGTGRGFTDGGWRGWEPLSRPPPFRAQVGGGGQKGWGGGRGGGGQQHPLVFQQATPNDAPKLSQTQPRRNHSCSSRYLAFLTSLFGPQPPTCLCTVPPTLEATSTYTLKVLRPKKKPRIG